VSTRRSQEIVWLRAYFHEVAGVADLGTTRIRKVTVAAGTIKTVAGGGTRGLCDGCLATQSGLASPTGVALTPSAAGVAPAMLYISDPSEQRIRRVAF
jgi:enoyl-[acyl-carrier-protein] reductase (NADH)